MKKIYLFITTFLFCQIIYTQHIAEGGGFSLSICDDGNVISWGHNNLGQLGNNTTGDDEFLPVSVYGLNNVKKLAAGNTTSLALKNDGTVWSWGENNAGACGDNTTVNRFAPVQVVGPDGVGYLTDIIDVAAGAQTGYALRDDGTVWAWGSTIKGALGNNENSGFILSPAQVHGQNNIGFLSDVIQIEANTYSAYALKSDGTVWSWGDNAYENLGDGTDTDRFTPVQVFGLTDVVRIAAGTYCAFAIKSDGTVWAWGGNDYGKLGNGSADMLFPFPEPMVGIDNAIGVAAGQHFTMILKSDYTVWTCGNNTDGQLGDGTVENKSVCIATVGVSNIKEIAAGGKTALVMDNEGNIYTWGDNYSGQLGDGSTTDRWTIGAVEAACSGLLGVNETITISQNLLVYPNPADNDITIQTAQPTNNKIQVFNAHGVLVKTLIVNNTISKIDITDLPAGIYIMHANDNLNAIKIIVQ